jgi:hypothetical protein
MPVCLEHERNGKTGLALNNFVMQRYFQNHVPPIYTHAHAHIYSVDSKLE